MAILPRHFMIEGDRLPAIELAISSERTGLPLDLTEFSNFTFSMKKRGSGLAVLEDVTAELQSATQTPQLRYDWQEGDTDEAGVYEGSMSATDGAGRRATWPNDGYILITILRRM